MSGLSQAERLLHDLGIRAPGEIDLEAIAFSQGALVKFRPMDRCEATIVGNARHAIIAVNSESIHTRKRFSLAHEIGHWHLHRNRLLLCTDKQIGRFAGSALDPERQADDFASDLILPGYLFDPLVRRMRSLTIQTLDELAGTFDASRTATLMKAVRANRFPVAMVRDGLDGRRWFWKSEAVSPRWRLRTDLDAESFAFGMLHKGDTESSHPRMVGADAWFEFPGCQDHDVREQSFRPSSGEVITVVTVPERGHA